MSDFTNEELEYMYMTINIIIEWYPEPDIAYRVRDKLMVLLEVHCNHDYQPTSRNQVYYQCTKCEASEWRTNLGALSVSGV